jgi:hypothetical protein
MEKPLWTLLARVSEEVAARRLRVGGADPSFQQLVDLCGEDGTASCNGTIWRTSYDGITNGDARGRLVFELGNRCVWGQRRVDVPCRCYDDRC